MLHDTRYQSFTLTCHNEQRLTSRLFMWHQGARRFFALALGLCLLFSSFFSLSPVKIAFAASPPTCNRHVLPVTLSALNLFTYHVVGWLCYKGPLTSHQSVQLLVHGATYSHVYWDFPYQPATYSYVQAMTNAGYAVFNFDRIGAGQSDHPPATLLTIQDNGFIIHEIVGMLKSGSIEGQAFKKVLLVGHSVGSAISVSEASTYADVDAVLLTGFLHFVDPAVLPRLTLDIYPAALDPLFRNSGLPVGYITTKPNTRGSLFYYLPNADPQVIATDEATKDAITDSEFATFFTISNSPLSALIHVPVLVAVGQYDNLFCLGTFSCTNMVSVKNYEALYYSPQANLQLIVIPQAGHDLNLQRNAPTAWFPQALQWAQSTVIP